MNWTAAFVPALMCNRWRKAPNTSSLGRRIFQAIYFLYTLESFSEAKFLSRTPRLQPQYWWFPGKWCCYIPGFQVGKKAPARPLKRLWYSHLCYALEDGEFLSDAELSIYHQKVVRISSLSATHCQLFPRESLSSVTAGQGVCVTNTCLSRT